MTNLWLWILSGVLLFGLIVFGLRHCDQSDHLGVGDVLNTDGIRNDVYIAINSKFPESEKKRAAAIQLAKSIQRAVNHPDEALTIADEIQRAHACMDAIEMPKPENPITDTSDFVEAVVVNSAARARAYIRFNSKLSGGTFSGLSQDLKYCGFDSSQMKD